MCLSIADRVLNQSDIESVWVLTLYSLYPDIASVVSVCWDGGLQRLDVHCGWESCSGYGTGGQVVEFLPY